MKNLRVVLVLGAVVGGGAIYYASQRTDSPAQQQPATLEVGTAKLENGLETELLAGDCGDHAAMALLLRVGADHDPPERSGMAHLVERMLAAGAKDRSVFAGGAYTLVAARVPRDRLLAEIDALAELCKRPGFDRARFDAAKAEVLAELKQQSGGDPTRTATTYAVEAVKPSRGEGRRGGIANEVQSIELGDVEAFWRAHFTPRQARLVVVGAMDREAVRARIEQAFGALAAGTPPVLRSGSEARVIGNLVMGDAPSALALAVPAPAPTDDRFAPFLVLAARLAEGGASWKASYDPLREPGLLVITDDMKQGEAPEAAATRLRGEVGERVRAALAPGDAARARERYARFVGAGEREPTTCQADPLALAVARARRAELGLDEIDLLAALDEVTGPALTEAAALFDPKRTTVAIAGGAIEPSQPPPTDEDEGEE